MEILMKLKCSPSAPGSALSTLKVVDHHHQLHQHTLGHPSQHVGPQSTHHMPLHPNAGQIAHLQQTRMPPTPLPPHDVLMPTACLEYATATMDCCSVAAAAAQRDIVDLRYASHHGSAASEYASVYGISGANAAPSFCDNAYGAPPCCSGITSYGMNTTSPPTTLLSIPTQIHPESELNTAMSGAGTEDYNMRYEYHEPEENFVSIDDAKIKGFLMRIGQEEDARRAQHEAETKTKVAEIELEPEPVVFEIIELDDEEEREKLMRIKNQAPEEAAERTASHAPSNYARPNTNSPSISLIPKSPELIVLPTKLLKPHLPLPASEQKIIANIELLDSSSEDEVSEEEEEENAGDDAEEEVDNEDDEVLPVVAVSCELEDDDDDADETLEIPAHNSVAGDSRSASPSQHAIVILPSDDDENCDFIDEQEEGVELRWDDLEEQKERTFFECFLCGKKVQSSYNLRRHMMIHTGERPFGCDMCDRRFREFSDLKKHRRRHANENNFVCMVCRVNTPTENDPTRCGSCDTKNGALIAAAAASSSSRTPQLLTAMTPQNEERLADLTTPPPSKIQLARSRTPVQVPAPVPAAATALSSTSKSSSTASAADTHVSVPPLMPISAASAAAAADTQHLLDTIPAVHRPAYNQLGVVTRREFPCPLCQRPFGTRHNLKRHFMIHTGEKPFACAKCRKPFREYSTLKKHMVTHLRDRWYKCLRCPQKYRDYLDYMAHRNTHPKESALSAASSSGGSSAATPSPKKRTKSCHNDYEDDSNDDGDGDSASADDWLECCECGQRFTDIEAYTEHLKKHDPSLYLFECYICKESFEQRDELEQHVEEQHDDRDHDQDHDNHKRKKSGSDE